MSEQWNDLYINWTKVHYFTVITKLQFQGDCRVEINCYEFEVFVNKLKGKCAPI